MPTKTITSPATDPRALRKTRPADSSPEPAYSIAEIAAAAGVTERTVRKWIELGQLDAVRVGARFVRVRQSSWDMFLAGDVTPITRGGAA